HWAGELIFAGTIATTAASKEEDRNRNCMLAAHLAKWDLRADAVVLTYGAGAPSVDMGETARLCEAMGMHTVVQVATVTRDRRVESAMMFNYPEVNAIVYVGGNDTRWKVPAAERVIAGSPTHAAALAAPQEWTPANVCGVANQQGASRLRSAAY
ncbi:MAG: hypothetical protein HY688_02605, partial [Chloroflexi bacterium]|nr:hypothetical protein [Chloroflexota bacterium]